MDNHGKVNNLVILKSEWRLDLKGAVHTVLKKLFYTMTTLLVMHLGVFILFFSLLFALNCIMLVFD